MATTHLLAGLLIALPVVAAYPSLAIPALVGAIIGSVLPDLDLYYGHRRTLHFPTYGPLAALVTGAAAIVWPGPVTVGVAMAAIGMALHARMDRYGGGLELRPWEGTSDRAVYDHWRGRWHRPRRFVRYDGAPEDVALASVMAVPALLLLEGVVWYGVVAVLAISILYALIRKPIVDLGVLLLRHAPGPMLAVLPMRYLEEELADRL